MPNKHAICPRNFAYFIDVHGFSPSNLESLAKVSGAGEHESSGDSVTIGLPARHSTIFKLAGGRFDHLRKALSLKSPKS
ncbi:MAG: hypothetical protein K1X42_03010 [Opitutaceae bacterium]|nr:hypothetical protein [Opitutaceae bacterium]